MSKYEEYQEALHYFIKWLNPIEEDFNQEIYRKHRNNLQKLIDKEKVPTLEEVIKEWEKLGFVWNSTSKAIFIKKPKKRTIAISLLDKSYESYFYRDYEARTLSFKEHQLLTKTFKALGWLEDDN